MRRHDYIMLAEALRNAYSTTTGETQAGVELAAERIAQALGDDNPRFDGDFFWAIIRGEIAVPDK